jgi:hypothetical protein
VNVVRNSLMLCALMLASCSGGHGDQSSGSPVLPTSPPQTANESAVTFNIVLPTASSAALRRAPAYISGSTQSVSISVTPSGGSAGTPAIVNCSTVACSGTLNVPVGSDSFTFNLFDGSNGLGHVLSTGTTTQTIVAAQANSVNLTFNGVVNSVSVSLNATGFVVGTSTSVTVTVLVLDAGGNTIVGPGNFADAAGNPLTIHLADSDSGGATALSQTSLTAPPSGPITLSYNGNVVGHTTITLSGGTLTPSSQSLTVTDSLSFTGANQTIVVPAGVTSMSATVAAGASGIGNVVHGGAQLHADIPVTAGDTLTVVVGDEANYFVASATSAFGGGGAASESFITGTPFFAGGGGGASAILAASGPLIVAGAAGGVDGDGVNNAGSAGGSGGIPSGISAAGGTVFPGSAGQSSSSGGGAAGAGGNATGGNSGASTTPGGDCTTPGPGSVTLGTVVGHGSNGASCNAGNNYGGGGGGGGFAGGGAGGSGVNGPPGPPGGGGGGGGSSFVVSGATIHSVSAGNNGVGSIVLSW